MFNKFTKEEIERNIEMTKAHPIPEGVCGGCATTTNVVKNICNECQWIDHNELTPSEQDALDALEYANSWIW